MGVRRHTRANVGIRTYRWGGLSVAEVRTLVVLGSRTVLGVPGEGSCSHWMHVQRGGTSLALGGTGLAHERPA